MDHPEDHSLFGLGLPGYVNDISIPGGIGHKIFLFGKICPSSWLVNLPPCKVPP